MVDGDAEDIGDHGGARASALPQIGFSQAAHGLLLLGVRLEGAVTWRQAHALAVAFEEFSTGGGPSVIAAPAADLSPESGEPNGSDPEALLPCPLVVGLEVACVKFPGTLALGKSMLDLAKRLWSPIREDVLDRLRAALPAATWPKEGLYLLASGPSATCKLKGTEGARVLLDGERRRECVLTSKEGRAECVELRGGFFRLEVEDGRPGQADTLEERLVGFSPRTYGLLIFGVAVDSRLTWREARDLAVAFDRIGQDLDVPLVAAPAADLSAASGYPSESDPDAEVPGSVTAGALVAMIEADPEVQGDISGHLEVTRAQLEAANVLWARLRGDLLGAIHSVAPNAKLGQEGVYLVPSGQLAGCALVALDGGSIAAEGEEHEEFWASWEASGAAYLEPRGARFQLTVQFD